MAGNILVNSRMEIDDRNEGTPVRCGTSMQESTEGPNRWFAQVHTETAEVEMERIMGGGPAGTHSFCRLRVLKPAREVVGLDRLQLFQPIADDELYGVATGEGELAGVPLRLAFSIRLNLDLNLAITLNSGKTDRNYTTMRPVAVGSWQRIVIDLPADEAAPWGNPKGRVGMYFQLGLSCGETRLSTIDGEWNDGHFLMIAGYDNARFLTTAGATADITACYFGPQRDDFDDREPAAVNRIRAQRFCEKSYRPGTRPGTPNTPDGSLEISGSAGVATGRAYFGALKNRTQRATVFSPTSGRPDMAWDVTGGGEVAASVVEQGPRHLVIGVPNARPGHVYRVHWLAHEI